MQLLSAIDAYYVKSSKSVLKCCKKNKKLSILSLEDLGCVGDFELISEIYGVIGILVVEKNTYLLVITNCSVVGNFRIHSENIYKIDRIFAIQINDNDKIDVIKIEASTNAIDKLKSSHKKMMKFVSGKIQQTQTDALVDDLLKMFNENGDFYFSYNYSLTLSTQKFAEGKSLYDESFWWNKKLLSDVGYDHEWSLQIIQGHVAQTALNMDVECLFVFTIISRRSVDRAGTRYLKRGVDGEGNAANSVESETIASIFNHQLSFVQLRASVPVYWSQKGLKYRPPLTIDMPFDKSFPTFEKHFAKLKAKYDSPIVSVNLVDQVGRELSLAKSYLEHAIDLDDEDIHFVSFDFHHHCRGMKLHKVQDLIVAMEDQLNKIGFCWMDKEGIVVKKQSGVIRTNCVDCLDRTNVFQALVSQVVCVNQARKLGLIGPLVETPKMLTNALQIMWSDNGDAISRQYAGTNALKGDITRNGQRKVMGLVKDGYNSASRYYLSQMKDHQKQKVIDLITGNNCPDDCDKDEVIEEEESENIARLVTETIHFVLPDGEVLVGSWAMVEGSDQTDQIDTVLLLTRSMIYIAVYDDSSEKLLEVRNIPFSDVVALETGALSKNARLHLRIKYKWEGKETFISYRAAKTRLFNNVAIPLKDACEADDYVGAIGEQICMTMNMMKYDINIERYTKLSPSVATNIQSKSSKRSFVTNSFKSILGIKSVNKSNETMVDENQIDEPKEFSRISEARDSLKRIDPTIKNNDLKVSQPPMTTSSSVSSNVSERSFASSFIKSTTKQDINPFEEFEEKMKHSKTHFVML
uniref:SAC domain-containing protein n=1 Tax=Rhabditophanes sp. KR3021 TaxID=114890 RepID=A0AC35U967_9BILA